MCVDGLLREESAGGHFRVEHQTEDGEAKRNDDDFAYVSAWQFNGVGADPTLHKENLDFEFVKPSTRSYK
jgi:succinate dehydrogenase / fumarate reductase, flavoprotein subunit